MDNTARCAHDRKQLCLRGTDPACNGEIFCKASTVTAEIVQPMIGAIGVTVKGSLSSHSIPCGKVSSTVHYLNLERAVSAE